MKTLKAAICDDEDRVLPYLAASIKEVFRLYEMELETETFTTVTALWDQVFSGKEYDIYFLDIDIPDYSGIQAAERIRKLYPDGVIVFVSAKEERVFETFSVAPAAFVRKEQFQTDLKKAVQSLHERVFRLQQTWCVLHDAVGGELKLDLEQVMYLEAQDKYVDIITLKKVHLIRQTITELEKELEGHSFVRIHRSYLVNCKFIYRIGKNKLFLDNGRELPVSRYRMAEVKKCFCDYSR